MEQRRLVCGRELRDLPVQRLRVPMVCQIFNWVERPEVEGVRLVDLLAATGIDSGESGFFAFYSKDGLYFEGLAPEHRAGPAGAAGFRPERAAAAQGIRRPLRLWVPFLQGYKSVKWVHQIRVFQKDPVGIKRLLGQSKTAILGPRRPGAGGNCGRKSSQRRRRS